ncbi:hypothetical protein IFM89_024212 [Coptis chinensis]|uniref:CCHC-type domain-containing protein n=1 Tax=Coptis chinensis TaxID=261450 RepID=A0A835HAU5_9MAGN|nr:hypothetical protein IFM89_024212 [Coptis chinensis]
MDQDFCTQNIHEYLDELKHASEGLNDVENAENMVYESDNTELNGGLNGELNDGLNGKFNGGLNDELNAGSDDEGDKYKYDKTFGPVFGSWMDAGYDSVESESDDDEYNPTYRDYSDNDLDNDIDPMVVDEEVHLEEELQGSVLANVMGISRSIYEEEEVAKVANPVVEKFGLCELKPKMVAYLLRLAWGVFVTMAIKHRFSFRQVRNDKFRVILVCKEPSSHYFPDSNHRYCFRHMYKNFKKIYSGELWENLVWGAARAYKKQELTRILGIINKNDPKALDWFDRETRSSWARAHFDWISKCDELTNNFSESFNNWILKIRDKPLVRFIDRVANVRNSLCTCSCCHQKEESGKVVKIIIIYPYLYSQDDPEELVLPPEMANKVGRPRKQRIKGDDEPPKTRRKCTKCGELGHKSITCDQRQKGIYGKKKRKGVPGQEEPTEALV